MLDLLKIAIILVTAPFWLPFVKAIKREVFDLFEEDGGLFGDDPGPLRRAAIQARRASEPSVLVHEWLAHVRGDGRRSVVAPGRRVPTTERSSASRVSAHARSADAGTPRRSFR